MDTAGSPGDGPVPMGHVSGVHGVRGWVKIYSHTRPKEAILQYQPWLLGTERKEVRIVDGRRQGKTLVVLFPGVSDRDQARQYLNQEIAIHPHQLPKLQQGEYYWTDLIGLEVVCVDGTPLGKVREMLETGANDVLVVQGERQRLIPFVQGQYVTAVDLQNGTLTVDWDADF
jgi:16S rRNA processing protein RimM